MLELSLHVSYGQGKMILTRESSRSPGLEARGEIGREYLIETVPKPHVAQRGGGISRSQCGVKRLMWLKVFDPRLFHQSERSHVELIIRADMFAVLMVIERTPRPRKTMYLFEIFRLLPLSSTWFSLHEPAAVGIPADLDGGPAVVF